MTSGEPMGRIPKQKRSEETRARIIEAGKELFSRDGYHSTSSGEEFPSHISSSYSN